MDDFRFKTLEQETAERNNRIALLERQLETAIDALRHIGDGARAPRLLAVQTLKALYRGDSDAK